MLARAFRRDRAAFVAQRPAPVCGAPTFAVLEAPVATTAIQGSFRYLGRFSDATAACLSLALIDSH